MLHIHWNRVAHYGKTPPCTNLPSLNLKLKKLFYAIEDVDH